MAAVEMRQERSPLGKEMTDTKLNLDVLERIAERGRTITPSDTLALIARIRYLEQQSALPDGWQPIETAPRSKTMYVVIGVWPEYPRYVTDPYCVWWDDAEGFVRWPHEHQPTHWMPLPAAPATQHTENDNG